VTRERIRQIEAKSLTKLKKTLQEHFADEDGQ
jgi:DNA-directed RNA polymerase sigma subunit (sigma70/sigma32)